MTTNKIGKLLISIALIVIMISNCISVYSATANVDLTNSETQYMELKVVSIEDVENKDKQVILEWWSYNLKFIGLDLRFSYDETKIKPSTIDTNDDLIPLSMPINIDDDNYETLKNSTNFKFAGDFSEHMGYSIFSSTNGEYRCYMSLEEEYPGTYIKDDSELGYVVDTNVDGRSINWKNEF